MDIEVRHAFMRKVRISIVVPLLLIFSIWTVAIVEFLFDMSFIRYGVLPRNISHSYSILLSPFIHKDLLHLWTNTLPLFLLSWGLFFFYRKVAYRIFPILFIGSGLLLWCIGRNAYHIGASGLIYALASFIFLGGLLQKNYRLTAISLIISFLYGSLIWGILPIENDVSWEGHLSGLITGLSSAIFIRRQIPKLPPSSLETDDNDEIPEEIWNYEAYIKQNPEHQPPTSIGEEEEKTTSSEL